MDSTHWHLLLNHFPIIGTILGAGVMAYGYFAQSEPTKKAALLTWIVMALVAIPVLLTGEPTEESVENLAGVSEAIIGQHEEAAELAFWVMEALGVFALFAFFIKGKSVRKAVVGATFALSFATFGLMAYTGYLGGQIRHTEIRSDAAAQTPTEQGSEKDDDESAEKKK
ncbi:MAG: hypothetical protein LH618_16100 [Saprospiraceae bacterium]|nr:hypothetical protein [Saprospiraceae bacterium]